MKVFIQRVIFDSYVCRYLSCVWLTIGSIYICKIVILKCTQITRHTYHLNECYQHAGLHWGFQQHLNHLKDYQAWQNISLQVLGFDKSRDFSRAFEIKLMSKGILCHIMLSSLYTTKSHIWDKQKCPYSYGMAHYDTRMGKNTRIAIWYGTTI